MNALQMLRVIECCDSPTWEITFDHNTAPKSKSRPRFDARPGRKPRVYTPGESRAAEDHLALSWRLALRGKTYDGGVAVACVFYRPNRQRIDADNMAKLVLDAGTKARAWHDDCQVVTIIARVELDVSRPRTEVAMIPSTSTLDREMFKTSTCPRCLKVFTVTMSEFVAESKRSNARALGGFCSNKCGKAALLVLARCVHCGSEFARKRAGQSLCSNKCKEESAPSRAQAMIMAGKRPAAARCQKCGGKVSRREYLNCAGCRKQGRPLGSKNKPKSVAPGGEPGAWIRIAVIDTNAPNAPAQPGEEKS